MSADILKPLVELRKIVQVELVARREREILGIRDTFSPIGDIQELADAIDYALKLDAESEKRRAG